MLVLELPDDCVRHVFDKFPLCDLVQFRAVCRQWNALIETVCSEKRVLRLFGKDTSREWYCDKIREFNIQNDPQFKCTSKNSLLIKCPTRSAAVQDRKICRIGKKLQPRQSSIDNPDVGYRFVVRLFPNVDSLVFSNNIERLEDLFYLLRQWSQNVSTLIILGAKGIQISKSIHRELWSNIGSMQSLTGLHLFDLEYDNQIPPDIKILSKLESFSFDQYSGNFVNAFRQLGPSLRHLRIGTHQNDRKNCDKLELINQEVIANVTHLSCAFEWIDSNVSEICVQFDELKFLDISSIRVTVSTKETSEELFEKLSKLKNLEELKVSWTTLVNGPESNDRDYLKSLPTFSNVKVLRLTDSSTDLGIFTEYKFLKVLFPLSERIFVEHHDRDAFNNVIEPALRKTFGNKILINFVNV